MRKCRGPVLPLPKSCRLSPRRARRVNDLIAKHSHVLTGSRGRRDNSWMSEAQAPRKSFIVSAMEGDGSIVETVYCADKVETAFAVARGGNIEIASEWKIGNTTHVPVRASNNLLKHRALLLPS